MNGRRAHHGKAAAIVALVTAGLAYGRYHSASSWFDGGWKVALVILTIAAASIFGFGIYRRVSIWLSGSGQIRLDHVPQRFKRLLLTGVLQRKVLRDPVAGPMHFALSAAFILLLAWYTIQSLGLRVEVPPTLLDLLYVTLGVTSLMAIYLRFVARRNRLRRNVADVAVISLLLAVAASYLLDRAAGGLPDARPQVEWTRFLHVMCVSSFLALIPYTKLFHVVTAPLSIFFAQHERQAIPAAPFNLREQTEEQIALQEGSFGLTEPADLPLFRLLSLDACTECGRCTEVCPANRSGTPLSPMDVVLKLRDMARDDVRANVWDSVTSEEVLSCTTCGACVAECPVSIEHVGMITDLRRDLVYEGSLELGHQRTLQSIAEDSNPWGQPSHTRGAWAKSEGLEVAEEGEEYDYLYWLGCAASFDPRVQQIARTVYKLLTKAGLRVAVLGQEQCTGDIARRIGDEGLFQKLAVANIAALEKVKAKAIVTHCPHCFHTMGNEYSLLGAKLEVVHHTELLSQLVESGQIRLTHEIDQSVTYHDPCYLGRHNGVFEAPRALLNSLPSADIREMERSRDKSFCCGAGGANMWLGAEFGDKRINVIRTEQALETEAQTIATACPFCAIMMEEGVQLKGADSVKVKDISELIAEAAD